MNILKMTIKTLRTIILIVVLTVPANISWSFNWLNLPYWNKILTKVLQIFTCYILTRICLLHNYVSFGRNFLHLIVLNDTWHLMSTRLVTFYTKTMINYLPACTDLTYASPFPHHWMFETWYLDAVSFKVAIRYHCFV